MILNCQANGETFPIDLAAVTGWDALSFDLATGLNLEQTVLSMLQKVAKKQPWTAAEESVALWLYQRQAVNPNVSLAAVAGGVQVFPEESAGSGGEQGADDAQGDDDSHQ